MRGKKAAGCQPVGKAKLGANRLLAIARRRNKSIVLFWECRNNVGAKRLHRLNLNIDEKSRRNAEKQR